MAVDGAAGLGWRAPKATPSLHGDLAGADSTVWPACGSATLIRWPERVILKVLGQGSVADLDAKVAFTAKQFLLAALVADEQLDDAALDEFLAETRKLADQWLA